MPRLSLFCSPPTLGFERRGWRPSSFSESSVHVPDSVQGAVAPPGPGPRFFGFRGTGDSGEPRLRSSLPAAIRRTVGCFMFMFTCKIFCFVMPGTRHLFRCVFHLEVRFEVNNEDIEPSARGVCSDLASLLRLSPEQGAEQRLEARGGERRRRGVDFECGAEQLTASRAL